MEITPIFIVGFLVLGTYKLVELQVRKKERLAIIEKLFTLSEKKEGSGGDFRLPSLSFGSNDSGSWTLRIALLLIGVGLGCVLSFIFITFMEYHAERISHQAKDFLNFSFIAIFGGLGLLIAYLIEKKQSKTKE